MADMWRPRQEATSLAAQAIQTMVPGSVHGRVQQAQMPENERRDQNGVGETIEAIFSYPGPPDPGAVSPPYVNRSAGAVVGTIIVASASAPTGSSTVIVMVNGATIATLSLPAGNRPMVETIVEDVVLNYGDQITVQAPGVGASLSGLTVQCLLEGDDV